MIATTIVRKNQTKRNIDVGYCWEGKEYQKCIEETVTTWDFEDGRQASLRQFVLPECLRMSGQDFESLWNLHPTQRDRFMQHEVPRWVLSYLVPYTYSGRKHESAGDVPRELRQLKAFCDALGAGSFQQVLVNWYERRSDNIRAHADNEAAIKKRSPIISMSFGRTPRTFIVSSPTKVCSNMVRQKFMLDDNSVIIMEGDFQEIFKHEVPPLPDKAEPDSEKDDVRRINVTFRQGFEKKKEDKKVDGSRKRKRTETFLL